MLDGTVDAVVSDHSPSTTDLKHAHGGDFGLSWGGIAGLQLGLAVVWTAARSRGVALDALLPALTTGPARVAGLDGLGVIEPGAPAHLVAFAPEQPFVVDARALEHRNPDSPYDGTHLVGVPRTVWLRGEVVVDGAHVVRTGAGRTLLPARSRA